MKHKHYDMIVAKAENMELETFINQDGEWRLMVNAFPMSEHFNYFLCLPQHKETCLHWLNGDKAQQSPINDDCWVSSADAIDVTWKPWTSFMKDDLKFRIKPKKEKRWIAVNLDGYVMPIHTASIESAREHASSDTSRLTLGVQFIEIEVEVTE